MNVNLPMISGKPITSEHVLPRCPACATPLRIRENRFRDTPFPCPACGEKLILVSSVTDPACVQRAPALATPVPKPKRRLVWRPVCSISPLFVAWSAAALVGLSLGIAWWTQREPQCGYPTDQSDRSSLVASQSSTSPAVPSLERTQLTGESGTVTEMSTLAEANVPAAADSSTPASSLHDQVAPPLPAEEEAPLSALTVSLPTANPPGMAPHTPAKTPVQVLLNQRLVSFQQSQPAARQQILATVEDLLDRPIRIAEDVPPEISRQLESAVTLELQNITVADLLRAILDGTPLEYACRGEEVFLLLKRP